MLENNEEKNNEEVKEEAEVKKETTVEDNETKKEGSIDTEKLKSETSNTVSQVKDTIKNVNIKEDSLETKNFVVEMFTKPVEKIKEVVEDSTQKTLKYAIIIFAVWVIISVLKRCFGGIFILPGGTAIWELTKAIITPALVILVTSVIILMLSKENKKSLTTIISTITIANTPLVISAIITTLNYIGAEVYKITSPISSFCSVITTVLTYFAVKYLLDKEDNEAIKSFAIVEIFYLIVAFAISFLGLYI